MSEVEELQQTELVVKMKTAFESVYANPEFIGSSNRVDKAIKALTMPDNTKKIIRQITTHVEKKMYTDAKKDKLPEPTEAEIKAEVVRKYKERLVVVQ
jgi:hypothetical protein